MASAYKKTAKDIAFDKERMKLKSEIAKLREELLYWKCSPFPEARESASQIEELYLQSLEYLDVDTEDFQKLREGEQWVRKLLVLANQIGS